MEAVYSLGEESSEGFIELHRNDDDASGNQDEWLDHEEGRSQSS